MTIYTLVSVTYDYYRFENLLMVSSDKDKLLQEVERLNKNNYQFEPNFEVLEYPINKIVRATDNAIYEIDELDSQKNHFWITKTKIK